MKNTITTSLELSKALEKAGFKQESMFQWSFTTVNGSGEWMLQHSESWRGSKATIKYFSSPTAEEILEELPEKFKHETSDFYGDVYLEICLIDGSFIAEYRNRLFLDPISFKDKSLANALAKLFIYLKEEAVK